MEILPFLCFLLMIGLFAGPWRERFLLASIGWGVLVLIITELLGLWHGLDRLGLAASWSVISIILGFFYKFGRPRFPKIGLAPEFEIAVMVIIVCGILSVTAVIACLAAPNNWDSMIYHLTRVAHWKQNKTVDLFPVSDQQQILYPPWSEYAMAQFYILAGGDRWVNFIQWFSSLGSMIGVSLIAARLKGDAQLQAFAALIAVTLPMGILQSTSTQNDYVQAFWLVCFVYFGLGLLQEGGWLYCAATAASLGLAWLVKGTGYIFGIPFLICLIFGGIKIYGRKF